MGNSAQGSLQAERYQRITLPDGRVLPGHDRSYLNQIIFDEDVTGQTMLDIGSHVGLFCIEGLLRGMRDVTGLEPYPESLRVAHDLAREFNVQPRYLPNDFETWQTDETFDVVLCLNVLHHMYDPVHALRRMMAMARRKIVLEVAMPTLGEMAASKLNPLLALAARNAPVIVCGCRGSNVHAATRTFLFTRRALETIFNYHSCLYEPIKICDSPLKERMIVEARRRVIRHLTVISGPSACGKSTFMHRLKADAGLRQTLGLPDKVSAHVAGGMINRKLPDGPHDHVILHYDMLRPFGQSLRCYERDPACDLIRVADKVSFLTLVTPTPRLREQLASHRLAKMGGFQARLKKMFNRKLGKRHRKLLELYANPGFLADWYAEWFKFCGSFREKTVSHALVENQGTYRFHALDCWEELSKSLV